MSSTFQGIREYLENNPGQNLGGNLSLDNKQTDGFAFGAQLASTRDKDSGKKIGIIGAGDAFEKFIAPTHAQRGGELYVYDPRFKSAEQKDAFLAKAKKIGVTVHVVDSINNIPDDVDHIEIITPPAFHKDLIIEAAKKGKPLVVEKPLTGNREDAIALNSFLSTNNVAIYCIDWEVMHALPLLSVAGLKMPFTDAVQSNDPAGTFSKFDFSKIIKADARFVEGGGNNLGDLAKAKKDRPWLFDYRKGGGILSDMAVHCLNTLAVLGFKSREIKDVILANPTDTKGEYERFGKEAAGLATGEIYVCAEITMGIGENGQDIRTIIEAGKNAEVNDGRIELTDDKGNILRWYMFPQKDGRSTPGSKLEMLVEGNVVATAEMQADCYSLVLEDVARWTAGGAKGAPNFPEHLDMTHLIADMHEKARSEEVAPGIIVKQFALRPSIHQIDLGKAHIKEPVRMELSAAGA